MPDRPDDLEVRHALDVPLIPLAEERLTLGDLAAGVAAALDAGVPLDATAEVEPLRRDRRYGRRLQLGWSTPPAPAPGRGALLLRRLRLTLQPMLEYLAADYAVRHDLPDTTLTVAFRPTRAMARLLFGWAATADRTAIRSATRRRYAARRRRPR